MTKQQVPLIDLCAAESDSKDLVLLDNACRDHGFFILSNHGIDREIEAMWDASRRFFARSRDEKQQVSRTQTMPLGYYDRELTKRKRDLKEVFDYMRPKADGKNLNQWPDDVAFKAALSNFFEAASLVADRVLKLVFLALEERLDASQPQGDPAPALCGSTTIQHRTRSMRQRAQMYNHLATWHYTITRIQEYSRSCYKIKPAACKRSPKIKSGLMFRHAKTRSSLILVMCFKSGPTISIALQSTESRRGHKMHASAHHIFLIQRLMR